MFSFFFFSGMARCWYICFESLKHKSISLPRGLWFCPPYLSLPQMHVLTGPFEARQLNFHLNPRPLAILATGRNMKKHTQWAQTSSRVASS